jgi:prepilin-type N-terminal cleavage/methylation domain-containing protein
MDQTSAGEARAGHAGLGDGPQRRRRRPGFTLIELLVVIAIIALVIAIIVPALAGARTVAKGGTTKQFLAEINKASDSYYLDRGRAPGYFGAREMGHVENSTRGLTAMQNVMLDLMGGIVDQADPNNPLEVGPLNDPTTHVWVAPGLMGAGKGYFAPDKRYLVVQDGTVGGTQFGIPEHQQIPSLVDAWGNPILAWVQDETAKLGTIDDVDQFALIDSGGNFPALFYWSSNAGMLKSTAMGKSAKDQNYVDVDTEYSLIGGNLSDDDRKDSLTGILGNPSFPSELTAPLDAVVPTQARGRTVLHSAGPDGVFFGSRDPGFKRLNTKTPEFKAGVIRYLNNFFDNSLNRWVDDKGLPTTEVVTDRFDDVLVGSGN